MVLLSLYRRSTALSAPLVRILLRRRLARGKEDPARIGERMGLPGRSRPSGPLVWAHGASVGESLSLVPLIARLLSDRPDLTVLCTTGTVASAALLRERLPNGAIHQFIPVDALPWVQSFLDHWRPDLLLLTESEFWPNLIMETDARGIPLVLLNGRVSQRSFGRWQALASRPARDLLGRLHLTLAQSEEDAERLRVLGAAPVRCPGNLKFAADPAPVDADALAALHAQLRDRPCWLALSTHPGDEALVARVHRRLAATLPGLLTIVMPRHARRGDEARAAMEAEGVTVAQRSRGDDPTGDCSVYLADTMGEVGLFARLASVVVMGKSMLGDGGGQNPLEPARLGAAVLFGPRMGNFRDIGRRMVAAGAARQVADEDALASALTHLLNDPAARETLSRAGLAFASGEAHVLDRVATELDPFLDPLAPRIAPAGSLPATAPHAHP